MNRDDAERFAKEWIHNWNARDVDQIVTHFAEDALFVSPVAARRTGNREVVGRQALQAYWSGVHSYSFFRFSLERVNWDPENQALVIVYQRETDARRERACELLRFDDSGKVITGEAMYGAEI